MTIPKLKAPDIGDIKKTLKINMGVSVQFWGISEISVLFCYIGSHKV